jgi:hypothetical protein
MHFDGCIKNEVNEHFKTYKEELGDLCGSSSFLVC